jgi:cytochrome c
MTLTRDVRTARRLRELHVAMDSLIACMKPKHAVRAAAAALLAVLGSGPAVAVDMLPLLTEKRCNACHDVTAVRIGPPYTAIAVRHRPDKESMVEVLAHKIVLGGGGGWGPVPMVPNEHVSLEEARAMARWILELPSP